MALGEGGEGERGGERGREGEEVHVCVCVCVERGWKGQVIGQTKVVKFN